MHDTIQLEVDGPVARVTLNRPEVRNAFNERMIAELSDAFTRLADRDEVRAVILSGSGRAFSAGADISWMRASLDFTVEDNVADALRMSDMFHTINSVPQPVVARVHGAALGGGMGLLSVCDIVVAAESTVFGFTEAKLGIIPAVISRFVVPKIGESWSRALFSTAERFGAELARQIGLVHWIASDEDLDDSVELKIAELLSSGPRALSAAKHLIHDVVRADPEQTRELTAHRIATLRTSPEGQEGLRAFLEKRQPAWRAEP